MTDARLDLLAINTIRTLSIDAVQAAQSGHPGTPMALAPLVFTLWNRVLRFDPQDPIWPSRDRFVLSNGHASMLLWSVLHLTGTKAVNADYEQVGEPAVRAVQAQEELIGRGVRSRVVSMPSWDVFEREPKAYRDSVLPPEIEARVVVEQASTFGWERFAGRQGQIIGMHTFGASAPLKALQQALGLTVERVVAAAMAAVSSEPA